MIPSFFDFGSCFNFLVSTVDVQSQCVLEAALRPPDAETTKAEGTNKDRTTKTEITRPT